MHALGKAERPSGCESCMSYLRSKSLKCCVSALMQPLPGYSVVSYDACAVLQISIVVPWARVSGKIKCIIPLKCSPVLEWRHDYPCCVD